MADLHAYCVALFFEGTTRVAMTLAGREAEAIAHVSVPAAREHDHPLLGVGVMQLETEWLRFALKKMEGGEEHKAAVVSLVTDSPRKGAGNSQYSEEQMRDARRAVLGAAPPLGWRLTPIGSGENPRPEPDHLMPTEAPDPA